MEKSESAPVIVVDLNVVAEEPVYAGLHGSRLEEAYGKAVMALRDAHGRRYRHPAPADDAEVFKELDAEVVLPHAAAVWKLFGVVKKNEPCTQVEEEDILRVLEEFIEALQRSE